MERPAGDSRADPLARRRPAGRRAALAHAEKALPDLVAALKDADVELRGFAARYPTPTAFIVDRDGILRHRVTGAKGPSQYRELVLPLLRR